jgi:hypothetical protein
MVGTPLASLGHKKGSPSTYHLASWASGGFGKGIQSAILPLRLVKLLQVLPVVTILAVINIAIAHRTRLAALVFW